MALSQRLRTAIERVDEIMSIAGVPGMSFAIIQNGETVGTFHRGFRDVARQLPPNDQTRWNVDSVSKAFTAAVTGITVHEGAGALNWESPIRTWLPEFAADALQGRLQLQQPRLGAGRPDRRESAR